jgi:hypothetical protein
LLRLQLAVKDKIIKRQRLVLSENGLNRVVGYDQLAAMERALMDADTPGSPPSPPRHLRNKPPQLSRLPTEEVDQISSAYSNPPSSRDPEPHSSEKGEWGGHYAPGDGQKISKIPPIVAQVKSASDPQRIITGAKSILGGPKKFPSPVKHQDLQSEYDDSQGHHHDHSAPGNGDFDIEESEDFHRIKPKPRQLANVPSGGALLKKKPGAGPPPDSDDPEESSDRIVLGEANRHVSKKPKAPALIFPSEGDGKQMASKPIQIRQGGLGQLNNGNKIARVQPPKGGRGTIQNEERWMEGGAGAGGGGDSQPSQHETDSKYQPTTPRGQKSHQRGSYETKFDRDRIQQQRPQPQHHQPHRPASDNSDDGLEVLDDISESYDSHAVYPMGGGGGYPVTDDDQSILSDISLDKGGGGGSPGQENHPRDGGGPKTRLKKQKNSVLGKLNKQRLRAAAGDPTEDSYGNGGGGPSMGPSLSELQIGPAQVPPGMMIPQGAAAGPLQAQQPRLVKQMKPVGLR